MIHGIKDLNVLLQGHENTYKYFCPLCRNDKNAKAASKRLKSFMMTPVPTLTKATSNHKQNSVRKQIRQSKVQGGIHSEHTIEEEISIDERIEEPFGKKVKPNPEASFAVITNFLEKIKEKETVLLSSPLDLAKKKLDSVFLKHQANKKRLPAKPEQPLYAFYYHYDIDKLLNLYAGNKFYLDKCFICLGKRVQLSEQEIKADLELFKEMSKTSTCHSEEKSNGSEFGMEVLTETTEEKYKTEQIDEFNGPVSGIRRKLSSRPKTKDVHYNENSPNGKFSAIFLVNFI